MSDWRLHTPIGLSDILPEECEKKKEVENIINEVIVSMGYREIETPALNIMMFSQAVQVRFRKRICLNSLTKRVGF